MPGWLGSNGHPRLRQAESRGGREDRRRARWGAAARLGRDERPDRRPGRSLRRAGRGCRRGPRRSTTRRGRGAERTPPRLAARGALPSRPRACRSPRAARRGTGRPPAAVGPEARAGPRARRRAPGARCRGTRRARAGRPGAAPPRTAAASPRSAGRANCASLGSPTTSAVIAPDGTLLAFQPYGALGLLLADLELEKATGLLARGCQYAGS